MRQDEDELPGGRLRNPGGTRGGLGEFFLGLALLVAGGYLFLDNVVVTSAAPLWGWGMGWRGSFGISLIPLFIGVALLFFEGRSTMGWVLTVGGAIAIVVGIIVNLEVRWRPSSLYYTIAIFLLMAAGLGLVARSLRAH